MAILKSLVGLLRMVCNAYTMYMVEFCTFFHLILPTILICAYAGVKSNTRKIVQYKA
jgi:hypothetical protein